MAISSPPHGFAWAMQLVNYLRTQTWRSLLDFWVLLWGKLHRPQCRMEGLPPLHSSFDGAARFSQGSTKRNTNTQSRSAPLLGYVTSQDGLRVINPGRPGQETGLLGRGQRSGGRAGEGCKTQWDATAGLSASAWMQWASVLYGADHPTGAAPVGRPQGLPAPSCVLRPLPAPRGSHGRCTGFGNGGICYGDSSALSF